MTPYFPIICRENRSRMMTSNVGIVVTIALNIKLAKKGVWPVRQAMVRG